MRGKELKNLELLWLGGGVKEAPQAASFSMLLSDSR